MEEPRVMRAFVSVHDGSGIEEFARALGREFGVQVAASGATAARLEQAGVPVSALSGPEGLQGIDMAVVNLAPFDPVAAGAAPGAFGNAVDVDDVALMRMAACDHARIAVVPDPTLYDDVLAEMRAHGGATTLDTRRALALRAFGMTAAYDTAVAGWLSGQVRGTGRFPETLNLQLRKRQDLRYGENPHQEAALYLLPLASPCSLANARQLNGKPLSYNNLLDADSCWATACRLEGPCVVVLKHQNPCGSAWGATIADAFDRALACDPKGAVGGVVAANRTVTAAMVERMNAAKLFVEVLVAPSYQPEALELLRQKPLVRVLETGGIAPRAEQVEYRTVDGGLLVQEVDAMCEDPSAYAVVTRRSPTADEMRDLLFAWDVVKGVKSNAILVAKDRAGIGLGPGQPNRVDSCRIACEQAGIACRGAVAASDAFFPFRDNIEVLARHGITAIIQPGGSIRDEESIAACDEVGMAMVFTGYRHFRH